MQRLRSSPLPASLALLLALASSLTAGCAPSPAPRNVLLIVVDTLRWDRLGYAGAERDTSPAIDALAARSVRFERAYSAAPWTKPSLASILTGLYPSAHGVSSIPQVLPEPLPTLAEMLWSVDYATAAVVSHTLIGSAHGFAQGFEAFDEREARGEWHLSTPGVTRRAIRLLERFAAQERPFLLFVHYFDPHYTYRHHPRVGFAAEKVGRLDGTQGIAELRRMLGDLDAAEVQHLRDLYDEEIRFTDAGIGRLLARLSELGLDETTIVVFTADHGEELLERGWLGHVRTLYEELVRVPLLVRVPGVAPRVVRAPVSLVSLTPTLLDLVGVEGKAHELQAPSLAPLLRGGPEPEGAEVFAEVNYLPLGDDPRKGAFKKALVGERYKAILSQESQRLELYDLLEDPLERHDLAPSRGELAAELRARLSERLHALRREGSGAPELELSEQQIEQLRALGYVGSP